MPPELMTRDQVAELLQVDPHTVSRWYRRGLIPQPIKVAGRQLRWVRRDLEEHLHGLGGQTPAARPMPEVRV